VNNLRLAEFAKEISHCANGFMTATTTSSIADYDSEFVVFLTKIRKLHIAFKGPNRPFYEFG
jgi:hypothetical protein